MASAGFCVNSGETFGALNPNAAVFYPVTALKEVEKGITKVLDALSSEAPDPVKHYRCEWQAFGKASGSRCRVLAS